MAGRGMPPTGQVGPQWAAAGSGSEEKVAWRKKNVSVAASEPVEGGGARGGLVGEDKGSTAGLRGCWATNWQSFSLGAP